MQLLPPPGWIKFVKQLRVPAAPFVSIPTALDFQPGRGERYGKEDRGNRKLAATSSSPKLLISPRGTLPRFLANRPSML